MGVSGGPLLTAAMIVKDEERHLTDCLQSIREVCDEIVIVDTGSVDGTVEIARSFGAIVIEHEWRQDFSAARNVGLDRATGRWILYIDADERLRPIAPEVVRGMLERSTDVTLRLRLRPLRNSTPYWEYRLWRSDPRIRFAGVMHEKITTSIGDVIRADRGTAAETPLFLEHVGYEGDQTHKHRRNEPLLRAQLELKPRDSHDWMHLAAVLGGLGEEEESEAALERAVQVARELNPPTGGLAFHRLILMRLKQGRDISDLLAEAVARYPDTVALAWVQLCTQMYSGEYEQALAGLDRFNADTELPVEEYISYDKIMFGLRPAMARAHCLFKLERYAEAAAAYAVVEELDPHDPSHPLRRALAEHRAVRQAGSSQAGSSQAAASQAGSSQSDASQDGRPGRAERWSARGVTTGFPEVPGAVTGGIAIDIAGVSVGLSATDAARAQAIRSLLGRMPLTTAEPQVRLEFGSHLIHPPARDPDESNGGLGLWHGADGSNIRYGQNIAARVERGLARLGGQSNDLARDFGVVAPFILADLLGPRGRYVIHCGAIQRDGQAVLVLGGSGDGKSTLVLGALRAGWGVLSDDLVVIRSGASGPLVSGIPKTLAMPGDTIGDEPTGRALPGDRRGRRELQFEAWDRGTYPVGGVVLVGHGDEPDAVAEPVPGKALVGQLLSSMLSRRPGVLAGYMSVVMGLCALPSCRLSHSSSPASRPERAVTALTDHLQATSSSSRSMSRHS